MGLICEKKVVLLLLVHYDTLTLLSICILKLIKILIIESYIQLKSFKLHDFLH